MTLWMPNKKKPLYAPMLATFGGGSVRGFKGAGSGPDLSLENFPVGHYETSNTYDSNYGGWFSIGFFGVDIGTQYKLSAGQDLSQVNLKYQSHDNNQVSFFVGAVELTSTNNYRVQWMGRIDKGTTNDVATTYITSLNNLSYEVGNPIIPSGGDYYLAWHSNNNSVSNNGYGGGNGMNVDAPAVNASSVSSIEYVAQGGIPSANQTFTSTNQATRAYMRLRFEV